MFLLQETVVRSSLAGVARAPRRAASAGAFPARAPPRGGRPEAPTGGRSVTPHAPARGQPGAAGESREESAEEEEEEQAEETAAPAF